METEMREPTPVYAPHEGTISISGVTKPIQAAKCAAQIFDSGNTMVDFVAIGNSATQQATKAMAAFRQLIVSKGVVRELSFIPLWFTVKIKDSNTHKTAIVWRTFHL